MSCCCRIGIIALRWRKFQRTGFRPPRPASGETYIELPIYQENLRASGDWRTGLDSSREWWRQLQSDPLRLQRFNLHWAGISRGASGEENFLNGVKTIYSWSEPFTAEGILSLNSSVFPEAPGFRATKAQCLSEAHDPPDAILVERLTANAVGWFGTEGFDGMNPVEQATLVYLRFMDLQAFAKGNEVMAVLLASYPLIRAGLPPLIFQTSDPRYLAALESGFRMLTQHLVNFLAETLASYPAMEF